MKTLSSIQKKASESKPAACRQETPLKDIQDKIKKAIRDRYGMSIYEFARSGIPEKFGVKGANLNNYLCGGSVSYTALKALYEHFGLGSLNREYKVVKMAVFYESTEVSA